MGLDVRSPIDYMSSNQQLIDQMMQSRLNRMYAEPERQAQLNMLQEQAKAYPQTLQTQNSFRQASAQNLMNPFRINQMLSSSGKHVLEPGLLNQLFSGKMTLPQMQQMQQMQQQPQQQMPQENDMGMSAEETAIPQQSNFGNINQQQLQDYYGGIRQKSSSDVATRNRVKFATNVEKTLQRIGEPTFFDKYTGMGGQLKLKKDQLMAATGKTDPELKKYNNFIHTQVPLLTSQIRQFYGDSIQPEVRNELKQMENPQYWYANPELAYGQYNELVNLFRNEAQTYDVALNAPTMTSTEAVKKTPPEQAEYKPKTAKKTYSQRLGEPIKELISSGGLTKEYFSSLPKEQRDAILAEMRKQKNG